MRVITYKDLSGFTLFDEVKEKNQKSHQTVFI